MGRSRCYFCKGNKNSKDSVAVGRICTRDVELKPPKQREGTNTESVFEDGLRIWAADGVMTTRCASTRGDDLDTGVVERRRIGWTSSILEATR